MSDRTSIPIRDEEIVEAFHTRRDEHGMSSTEYLQSLMDEATESRTRENLSERTDQLIELTAELNERLGELMNEGDDR